MGIIEPMGAIIGPIMPIGAAIMAGFIIWPIGAIIWFIMAGLVMGAIIGPIMPIGAAIMAGFII